MLDELNKLDEVLSEIQVLKKRSELLEEIMRYYNIKTMTFDIPAKWKGGNVRPDTLPAESPRHLLKNKIHDALSGDEWMNIKYNNRF